MMRPILAVALLLLTACGPGPERPASQACLEAQQALADASAGLSDFAVRRTPDAPARVYAAEVVVRERCRGTTS